MALFKKKDRSPYRHIGMALVPPAAFAAVPHSPPPTPSSKKKKKKVIASPIVPAMLGATATMRAISLGCVDNDLRNVKIQYESIERRGSMNDFIDEDDTYARIIRQESSPRSSRRDVSPHSRVTFREEEKRPPISHSTPATFEHRPTDDVYAVPKKGKAKRKSKSQPQLSSEGRMAEKHVDPAIAQTFHNSPSDGFYFPTPREGIEDMDGPKAIASRKRVEREQSGFRNSVDNINIVKDSPGLRSPSEERMTSSNDDVTKRQDELEEKMRLKDEQTRELILQLMQETSSPGLEKRGENPKTFSSKNFARDEDHFEEGRAKFQEDHDLIKEIGALLKAQSFSGAEGVVLKQQIQDMIDENETLKETVERLNIELSRFQAKYGPNPDDLDVAKGLPANGPHPKWLTDAKYLSPLFISYDQQLDMKDEVIASHEEKFAELGRQVEDILKENEILRAATKQTRCEPFISQQKWSNIKEQNNLMVEEIQLQLEQLQLMERKIKDMHLNHVDEVARLSKRLALTDAEYQESEKERKKVKEDLNNLTDKHDKLVIESREKVSAQEFVRAMSQCKSEIEDLKERHVKELKEVMGKVKETQKEKSGALLEVSEMNSKNKQLQGEMEALKENRTLLQEQIEKLNEDIDETEKRELECQLHLANVMKVAERAVSERETYAAVAEKEQLTSQNALQQSMREKWQLGKMEESLKHYKVQLASRNKDVNDRLQEVEESHSGQLMEYERKITHMRKLLHEKQQALEDMAGHKRQIENELETVWQAASAENRRIMESLHRSNLVV